MNYKLYINGLEWIIYFVQDDDAPLDLSCGITYKNRCEIYIDKTMGLDLIKRTINHELVHAYVWSYGFETLVARKFNEEDLANFIESFSEKILDDTYKVYDWFLDEENKNG